MGKLKLIATLLCLLPLLGSRLPVSVYGFDDFCYDGTCYDNPSGDLALMLGGVVVPVDWDAVEALDIRGTSVGIGLDPTTERAYINGSAMGRYSLAADGPDAGDYECGHLYYRLLGANRCSLFVHVPPMPTAEDRLTIHRAIRMATTCKRLEGK